MTDRNPITDFSFKGAVRGGDGDGRHIIHTIIAAKEVGPTMGIKTATFVSVYLLFVKKKYSCSKTCYLKH